MNDKEIDDLLSEENEHLKKLHRIVRDSIKSEELIISNLLNPPEETLTAGQKISAHWIIQLIQRRAPPLVPEAIFPS